MNIRQIREILLEKGEALKVGETWETTNPVTPSIKDNEKDWRGLSNGVELYSEETLEAYVTHDGKVGVKRVKEARQEINYSFD